MRLHLAATAALLLLALPLHAQTGDDDRNYINAPTPQTSAMAASPSANGVTVGMPSDLSPAFNAHDRQPVLVQGKVLRIEGRHTLELADNAGHKLKVHTTPSTALLQTNDTIIASGHLRKHLFGRVLEAEALRRQASQVALRGDATPLD